MDSGQVIHNLKKSKGSFKGLVAECMFKLTRKYVVLTRFFSRSKYGSIFGKYLTEAQLAFIQKYWFSLDAIEISFEEGKQVILYEVKSKNKYRRPVFEKPKVTLATRTIYEKARGLGFTVKLALVYFCDDWNYYIKLLPFEDCHYHIDGPRTYDAQG